MNCLRLQPEVEGLAKKGFSRIVKKDLPYCFSQIAVESLVAKAIRKILLSIFRLKSQLQRPEPPAKAGGNSSDPSIHSLRAQLGLFHIYLGIYLGQRDLTVYRVERDHIVTFVIDAVKPLFCILSRISSALTSRDSLTLSMAR
jgi:hypothetical protein